MHHSQSDRRYTSVKSLGTGGPGDEQDDIAAELTAALSSRLDSLGILALQLSPRERPTVLLPRLRL